MHIGPASKFCFDPLCDVWTHISCLILPYMNMYNKFTKKYVLCKYYTWHNKKKLQFHDIIIISLTRPWLLHSTIFGQNNKKNEKTFPLKRTFIFSCVLYKVAWYQSIHSCIHFGNSLKLKNMGNCQLTKYNIPFLNIFNVFSMFFAKHVSLIMMIMLHSVSPNLICAISASLGPGLVATLVLNLKDLYNVVH